MLFYKYRRLSMGIFSRIHIETHLETSAKEIAENAKIKIRQVRNRLNEIDSLCRNKHASQFSILRGDILSALYYVDENNFDKQVKKRKIKNEKDLEFISRIADTFIEIAEGQLEDIENNYQAILENNTEEEKE